MRDRETSSVRQSSDDQGWTVVEERYYDSDSTADLTTVVIEAVAAAENTAISSIRDPPLYEVVDFEAVNTLLGANAADTQGALSGDIAFVYRGNRITIHSDGRVNVAVAMTN